MCRPAKPGDTGILIRDEFAEGANVGKRCVVNEQCKCEPDRWTCTSLDPMLNVEVILIFKAVTRHGPGCEFCPRKSDVIVLEDPDAIESQPISNPLKEPAT